MKYDRAMSATLTLSCKLKVTEAQTAKLTATLSAFTQALNWVNAHTPAQIANALKLQSLCYYEVRARFGLSSNLAQQVCRRVAGSRKVAQQKNRPVKEFKKPFVTYDSARIFSFREKDWTVSLTTPVPITHFPLVPFNTCNISDTTSLTLNYPQSQFPVHEDKIRFFN
jgi:hypothetical protein